MEPRHRPADSAAAPVHRAQLFSPIGASAAGTAAAALDSPPPPPPPPSDRAREGAAVLPSAGALPSYASMPAEEPLDASAPLSARLAAVERSISARLAAIDRQVQQDVIEAGYAASSAEPTSAAGLRAERQRRYDEQRSWESGPTLPAASLKAAPVDRTSVSSAAADAVAPAAPSPAPVPDKAAAMPARPAEATSRATPPPENGRVSPARPTTVPQSPPQHTEQERSVLTAPAAQSSQPHVQPSAPVSASAIRAAAMAGPTNPPPASSDAASATPAPSGAARSPPVARALAPVPPVPATSAPGPSRPLATAKASPAPLPPPALSGVLRDRPTSRFSSLAASLTTHRRPSSGLPDASALHQLLAADEAARPGLTALSVTDEERDRIWRAERERDAAKNRASAAERAAMVGARALINHGSLAVYRKRYGDQPGVALAGQGSAAAAAVTAADAATGSSISTSTNGVPAGAKVPPLSNGTRSRHAAPTSSPRRLSRAPRDVDVSVRPSAGGPRRSSSATRGPADRSATRLADEAFSRRLSSVRQGAGRSQSAHRRATIGGSRHAARSGVRVGGKPTIRRSLADIVRASRALTTDADGNFVVGPAR